MRNHSPEVADAAQWIADTLKSLHARRRDTKRLSEAEFEKYAKLGTKFLSEADPEAKELYLDEFHQAYTRRQFRRLLDSVFKMINATVDRKAAEWSIQLEDRRADGKASVSRPAFIEAWYDLPGDEPKKDRARRVFNLLKGKVALDAIMRRAHRLGLKTKK